MHVLVLGYRRHQRIQGAPRLSSPSAGKIAAAEGTIKRNSFYLYLGASPVLRRHAQGLYGLGGMPPKRPKTVNRLNRASDREAEIKRASSLLEDLRSPVYRPGPVRDATEPRAVSSGASQAWPLVLLLGGLALALMAVAALSPRPARGEVAQARETVIGVSGETIPSKLPRSRMAPSRLRLGFTSETPSAPTTPEITAIRLEVSRNIAFQTAGLPSCPIADLYSESSQAGQVCAGSLIGHGTVISEVTLPGQAPATIEGHLLAFYDLGEGQSRILAQVTSAGAVPLTYVIPFTIEKTRGIYGTALYVHHMQFIAGICRRGHPNCFSQTYTYKGIYGHISKFDLALDRQFVHAGRRTSVVSADCPARNGSSSASFPLVKVNLAYSGAISRSHVATRRCEVSKAPRHRRRTTVKE